MFGLFKKKKVESLGDYQYQSVKTDQQPELNGVQLDVSPCTEKNVLASIKILREAVPSTNLKEAKLIVQNGGVIKTNLTAAEANVYVQQLNNIGTQAVIIEGETAQQMSDSTVSNTDGQVTLVLVDAGRSKMAVIKAIRESVPSLGLKEAKAIADNGGEVKADLPADEAEALKAALEEAGATIEIK